MLKEDNQVTKQKIENDPDFIYYPRLNNSLNRLLLFHPEGLSSKNIAKVLLMTEKEVEEIYRTAIKKLRKTLGVTEN